MDLKKGIDNLDIGAIAFHDCPDCNSSVLYTLESEHYTAFRDGESVPMLLYCSGCNQHKLEIKPENGKVIYEKKGNPSDRKSIPLVERLSTLPE